LQNFQKEGSSERETTGGDFEVILIKNVGLVWWSGWLELLAMTLYNIAVVEVYIVVNAVSFQMSELMSFVQII